MDHKPIKLLLIKVSRGMLFSHWMLHITAQKQTTKDFDEVGIHLADYKNQFNLNNTCYVKCLFTRRHKISSLSLSRFSLSEGFKPMINDQ